MSTRAVHFLLDQSLRITATVYSARSKQSRQEPAIEFLSKKSHIPVDEVARLYGNEMAKLEAGAHIMGFLSIFAIRNVREILQKRSAGQR